MKIICSKEELSNGISIVQKAVSTKTTMPILEGILIDVGEQFKLTGNDLELGIECFVKADIREPGSIVINSRMFGEIIKKLPDSEVLIEVKENNNVIIECNNSHFELKGMPSEGYPSIPEIESDKTFAISQKEVRDMIRQTLFAVSLEENRPIFTGSLIECKNNELTIVSIDGFRMAIRKTIRENDTSEFSVVVPGKALNEIVKILQPVDEEITIYSSPNQILFDIGNCKIVSRLLEGEYLNYRSIIPKEYETRVRANTKEMLSSIERASLITLDEKKFPVKFNISDENIIISSNTEIGAVREEVRVEVNGENMTVGFNPRYFIEALRVIEDEEVDMFFTTNIGPCTIRPLEADKFAYMILPVKINNE
jgi:DNA polymerase-3 subunit beta